MRRWAASLKTWEARDMSRAFRKKAGRTLKDGYIGLVFLFLYVPIVMVIIYSLNTSKMNILFEGFTTMWYNTMFKNRTLMEALWNTLIVAFFSTAVSTVIGTIGAVGMSKYSFKGKSFLDKLLYIPVVIPEIVMGIALLCMYSLLNIQLGLLTIILSHITFCIPFVVITVRARLAGMDKSMEEAAMDLGANRVKSFWFVTLPYLMPGVASGAVLSFSLSLDDVIISFFTCGPGSTTLPLKVFSMARTGVTPEVNALFTVIMLVTIAFISFNTSVQVRKLKALKD
jgi:spermidine/putrescine transport system permease protein